MVLACGAAVAAGCGAGAAPEPGPRPEPRSYQMGFSNIPGRPDVALALAGIDMWSQRADAGLILTEPPWDDLLSGASPEALVQAAQLGLASYYRAKGLQVWVYLEPGNGLDRSAESDALARRGRSITEPAVQQLYRRYAAAINDIVDPAHLGLALETNLIRTQSSPALYAAIRRVANDAAADVRARDSSVALSVSVQVDHAWGDQGTAGTFRGIETDLADFPFLQELGLSSYPYLGGFEDPEQVPLDYYARLVTGRTLPVAVIEGGWTSASIPDVVTSSPDEQRRYIARQWTLLEEVSALAVFQLTFTDLDLAAFPLPPDSIVPLFANLGLAGTDLAPKPALGAWDATFSRPRS
jgi:hypothetical protein